MKKVTIIFCLVFAVSLLVLPNVNAVLPFIGQVREDYSNMGETGGSGSSTISPTEDRNLLSEYRTDEEVRNTEPYLEAEHIAKTILLENYVLDNPDLTQAELIKYADESLNIPSPEDVPVPDGLFQYREDISNLQELSDAVYLALTKIRGGMDSLIKDLYSDRLANMAGMSSDFDLDAEVALRAGHVKEDGSVSIEVKFSGNLGILNQMEEGKAFAPDYFKLVSRSKNTVQIQDIQPQDILRFAIDYDGLGGLEIGRIEFVHQCYLPPGL